MRKLIGLLAKLKTCGSNRIAIAVATGVGGFGTGLSSAAHAQTTQGIGGVATMFNSNLMTLGQTVMGVSFLGGLGFVGSGLMKLKSASDSAGREPYAPGIWRLGVGAGLVGLPAMAAIMRDTATGSSGITTIQEGTASLIP
jgi:hypothetical protein